MTTYKSWPLEICVSLFQGPTVEKSVYHFFEMSRLSETQNKTTKIVLRSLICLLVYRWDYHHIVWRGITFNSRGKLVLVRDPPTIKSVRQWNCEHDCNWCGSGVKAICAPSRPRERSTFAFPEWSICVGAGNIWWTSLGWLEDSPICGSMQ